MKRRILMVFSILAAVVVLFLIAKLITVVLTPKGKGALQVTSNIKAEVQLNGKSIGSTPVILENENTIDSGVYDIKIIPEDKNIESYSAKVDINPGVLTAVDRTFLPGGLASAYVLTLEKIDEKDPQIFVASVPDSAIVTIDGESKDVTPYDQNISASEHEIEITKVGFTKKTIRVRAVNNYKLVLNVVLGTEGGEAVATPALSSEPTISISPTPTPEPFDTVTISSTPVGFLRVRESATTASREIGRVTPGERLELISETATWFQIKLNDGTLGWISRTYAEKNETQAESEQ